MTEAAGDSEPAGIAGLPEVPQAHADSVRLALARHRFVPSTYRLPPELLPDPALVTVIDQGTEGISVGVALAAVLNYLRARRGDTRLVSARMLYEFARRYDEWRGHEHEGSSLAGALAGLAEHGVCLDSEWPLQQKKDAPDAAAMQAALQNRPAMILAVDRQTDALRAAVFEHQAVLVSFESHEGWMQKLDGVIPYTRPKGRAKPQTQGGHAVAVLGYTAQGFLIQNSWGRAWATAVVGKRRFPGMAIWTYEDAADHLTDAWVLALSQTTFRPPQVSYDADSLDGPDLLEIRAEVEAFSYVLASSRIRPPLALGLFGDWGSGKSFFMQAMRGKIDALALAEDKRPPANAAQRRFCQRIVQIPFNAWHYLDADLWASLVTEIFDRLFQHIGGASDKPEARLGQLTTALGAANGVYQQAQQQVTEAQQARAAAQQVLQTAIAAREQREGDLATKLDDIGTLVSGDKDVRAAVDGVAQDLGVPEMAQSFRTFESRVGELGTLGRRGAALVQAMFMTPWGWWRLASLIMALLVPAAVVLGIEWVNRSDGMLRPIKDFHSFALQISGGLVAITAWLGAQARRGAALVARLENTHRRLQEIRSERRAQMVAREHQAVQALSAREDAARRSLLQAEQHVQALQREVAELQPGRLISRFIEERSRTADYRSRLGIVSLVRRDFERLSELADPASRRHDATLMPVERIILYIDDLDRCKPERVIEVLEAVHLLLAFRLFMVVVAVDPRWLRHCLEKHYPDLLAAGGHTAPVMAHVLPSRPATAQDYLEKIFQIPFLLQPLKDDGYRRMIQGLTADSIAAEPTAPVGAPADPLPQATAKAAAAGTAPREPASTEPGAQGDGAAHDDEAGDEDIERLELRPWEVEDMQRLAPLFRTPRAVKRFVNTYRFLRAGVRAHERPMFEGSRYAPGTCRAALVLLAIVVNHAAVAPRFLRRVSDLAPGRSTGWHAFLTHLKAEQVPTPVAVPKKAGAAHQPVQPAAAEAAKQSWEAVEWQLLCDTLLRLSDPAFPVVEVRELQPWVHTVARYSFSLTASTSLLRS